ncbi:MAG: acylneuraminate cytidylyltransferase family protein [Hydrogenophaga sp.]|uniref:acylneuraminate cytidylyltransferase family protein n=1 Tax=Hydrogenophaga sp. TaxID=1904254 RepID=UPI002624C3E3|nr:acylneuraminate cytidylyltransferase family protein [Hydrogenophaga sp.]MCV0437847.1 acylneuraminate cytidylyltransferase family protein [Hydrogenophaga sp.]
MSGGIAIVLARGGSVRLPRKNILDIGGRPMLAWSVQAALDSGCFERVLVSTDDPEIAAVARQHGAEVPFLRTSAADDRSTSSEATRVALLQAEAHWNTRFAVVAQFMANCPLRTAADVRAAMNAFESRSAPAQISCFRFGWMNPWWAATLDANGGPQYLFPETRMKRSQDLPALYCPSGALWLARRNAFLEVGSFYAPGHVMEPMDWMSAMDIDDESDLRMARACMLMRGDD